ncbi:DUF4280 domain-containing protein [Burkholderia sp. WAC0059]|uniref:DUF4280 domain-containing protein n=1 Tax=Burkholderia sp. WAC0059 TaxID=2066022 RepID=UPI000C7EDA26|nr:DUF4280 domain-containing protein [Burkholderia sp. WAC0059]PLZ00090.1 DUF4280 domain-containing protein [Burkholderia sp. WAC0059]
MGSQATAGAILQCSFGAVPASLGVLPVGRVFVGAPAATVMDSLPLVNVPSFGLCSCMANPDVAAATSAALGVLTPMPCMPATTAPWTPGVPDVLIGGQPALDDASKLACAWGGQIAIVAPGQFAMQVS